MSCTSKILINQLSLHVLVKIENIVCSGALNCRIDLKDLASKCQYVVYDKNKYPGGYVKFDNHSITIYSTGKYIMPGMRSFDDVKSSFIRFTEILSSYLDLSNAEEPEVRNMVCSSEFGSEIDLSKLYVQFIARELDAVYEPESFPGLILKTESATFNVFKSGKFLILGCTEPQSVLDSEKYLVNLFEESLYS